MNLRKIPGAVEDITKAEMRYGIYSEKASAVRRYWLAVVEPEKFEKVEYPDMSDQQPSGVVN